MATALKLVSFRPKSPQTSSPLTPELKDFIDRAIVPALVRDYLPEIDLAKPDARMALSDSSTAATRKVRP